MIHQIKEYPRLWKPMKLRIMTTPNQSNSIAKDVFEVINSRILRPNDSIAITIEESDVLLKYRFVLVNFGVIVLGSSIRVFDSGSDVGTRNVCTYTNTGY